jgi:hypothetical protein
MKSLLPKSRCVFSLSDYIGVYSLSLGSQVYSLSRTILAQKTAQLQAQNRFSPCESAKTMFSDKNANIKFKASRLLSQKRGFFIYFRAFWRYY